MRRVVYSILAREDLVGIGSYKVLAAVRERLKMLCRYPQSGKRRDDLAAGLLSYPVGPYVIFYRLKPGGVVFINRILHGRRDLPGLLRGE